MPPALASWLRRTLQFDKDHAITSVVEAWVELEAALDETQEDRLNAQSSGPSEQPKVSRQEPGLKPREWVTPERAPVVEITDGTFRNMGRIGLWTKADSTTCFDDVEARTG